MIRQDFSRVDAKRRATLDHRQKQFATPSYKELTYPNRLNFYSEPPTADITLEQFEQWAIDRLRGMARSFPTISRVVANEIFATYSSCGTRSVLIQKQNLGRNRNAHEADS